MRNKRGIMRVLKLFAVLATLTAAAPAAAQANGGRRWGPEMPHFNLQVVLRPAAGGPVNAFGLVKFRQPNDASKIVLLDVWTRGLVPNHSYYLERATDPIVNDDCTGTNWLTLGQGLDPAAITTGDMGSGRAALFRDLGALPVGAQFDIHFRVIDAVSLVTVLESGCYQFTVSQ
jgi:hypothetical protein